MKHKWHDEIVAWAGGSEIEFRYKDRTNHNDGWIQSEPEPTWDSLDWEYRIKPQPKEKKYLYVYQLEFEYRMSILKQERLLCFHNNRFYDFVYFGKIEVLDD